MSPAFIQLAGISHPLTSQTCYSPVKEQDQSVIEEGEFSFFLGWKYQKCTQGRMKEWSEAKLTGKTPSLHRCHAKTTQLQNVPKQPGYEGINSGYTAPLMMQQLTVCSSSTVSHLQSRKMLNDANNLCNALKRHRHFSREQPCSNYIIFSA